MWPLLSGQVDVSPRNETVIALQGHTGGASATGQYEPNNVTALIQGDYKLLLGAVSSNFWQCWPRLPCPMNCGRNRV